MTTQRGRKSAASKLVTLQDNEKAVSSRLPVPKELGPAAAKHWVHMVNAQPPGYFRAIDIPQMIMLCQMLANIQVMTAALETYTAKDLKTSAFMRYRQISTLLDKQTRAATSLQTRMRLTQYSVTRSKGAGKKQAEPDDAPGRKKKPWET